MSDINRHTLDGQAFPSDGRVGQPDLRPRHEERDVNIPGLLICAGVVAACVVIAFIASWWGFEFLSGWYKSKPSTFPLASQESGHLPPKPRLEGIDRQEGKDENTRAKELRILETYGWVDEKAGVIRIPISRAMKIIADNKLLPARLEEAGDRRFKGRASAANSGRSTGREP